ncbi:MAG: sel1 repeat family protein [Hyphomicrobiaceae bacterium]|nr:sel1 repeat family protein [Hyphomicrobiaceae bacterium]
MRISRQALGLALTLAMTAPAIAGAGTAQYRSPEEALHQGIGAFSGGYYEMAIPALEVAAAQNLFLARYYLARIYSDNQSAHTDHPKAYLLFQQIANDYADVDPDDDRRAPFVAKALTALAGYVRRGLPELGLKPDPERAAEYLHHAAIFFNDEDAQFELAKLQLHGEGVPSDVARGKHWLSILSQKGHAGAQAFLADLYSRGMFMDKDPIRALALISVAVKNAPSAERVWIEDIYQNIYCGASQGVRKQVTGMVAEWDSRYGRRPKGEQTSLFDGLSLRPSRSCENGEVVPLDFGGPGKAEPLMAGTSAAPDEPAVREVGRPSVGMGFVYGGTIGRDGGAAEATGSLARDREPLREVGAPPHIGPDR